MVKVIDKEISKDKEKSIAGSSWLKDKKTIQKEILKLISEWQSKLILDGWLIYTTFEKEVPMATCAVADDYYSAYLNFNLKRIEDELDTNLELEELVVHEMMHIVVWDMSELADGFINEKDTHLLRQHQKIEERLVTNISRSVVMAKYNLTVIPDTFVARLFNKDFKWEVIQTVTDGGEMVPRIEAKTKQN